MTATPARTTRTLAAPVVGDAPLELLKGLVDPELPPSLAELRKYGSISAHKMKSTEPHLAVPVGVAVVLVVVGRKVVVGMVTMGVVTMGLVSVKESVSVSVNV